MQRRIVTEFNYSDVDRETLHSIEFLKDFLEASRNEKYYGKKKFILNEFSDRIKSG